MLAILPYDNLVHGGRVDDLKDCSDYADHYDHCDDNLYDEHDHNHNLYDEHNHNHYLREVRFNCGLAFRQGH